MNKLNIPCTIKILIVVDGPDMNDPSRTGNKFIFGHVIQFNDLDLDRDQGAPPFGMGYIIDILEQDASDHVNFKIDCATRENEYIEIYGHPPKREVMVNFKFDQQEPDGQSRTIDKYDEIWLFGFWGEPKPGTRLEPYIPLLSDNEHEVLHKWMDNGGGILAMGDHEDLGAAMCKDIKRVRYMRHWTKQQGVPSRVGFDRHDTNQPATLKQGTGEEHMPFQNQSDNILQPLLDIVEHAILEISDGDFLDHFPDHPHEGEVYKDGQGIPEDCNDFPNGSEPETIAWVQAFIQKQKLPNRAKGAVESHKFGALGVYDGHGVSNDHSEKVGRIVVDSTWHHWFNINLCGMKKAYEEEKGEGDKENYTRYKIFVNNVACWLAPPNKQKQMYLKAIWYCQFTSQVMENYYISNDSWTYKDTQEILKTFVRESFRKDWLSLWYPKELLNPEKESRDGLFHEWSPYKCPHWEVLEAELLQGVTKEWRPLILEIIGKKRTSVEEQELTELFEKGANQGVWNAMNRWSEVIDNQRAMKDNYATKLPPMVTQPSEVHS